MQVRKSESKALSATSRTKPQRKAAIASASKSRAIASGPGSKFVTAPANPKFKAGPNDGMCLCVCLIIGNETWYFKKKYDCLLFCFAISYFCHPPFVFVWRNLLTAVSISNFSGLGSFLHSRLWKGLRAFCNIKGQSSVSKTCRKEFGSLWRCTEN